MSFSTTGMNILSKEIIKEWNLASLPPAKQAVAVERIGRILYQAILVKSLDILNEAEQTDLDLLLDKDSTTPQDVLLFLKEKIPTFEKLVVEERKSLKEDLLIGVL
jgi:hypothetical protein